MTNEQQFIISLLRKSLNTDGLMQIDYSIDENITTRLILRNGLLLTVYPALSASEKTLHLKESLQKKYLLMVSQAVNQNYEGKRVLNELSDAGFDCIALKGWELRNLYPKAGMRQMVDVDILVRPYDFHRIKEMMMGIGFSCGRESSWKHDSFTKGNVHIEMHKRLTDDSGEIYRWEKEMWSRAVQDCGSIYKMTIEDYYIFHFIHLHKDFMNGSLGLRRIVDTWLLMKQPKNEEFIRNELAKFGLVEFQDRVQRLSNVVMGMEEPDENSEILLNHAFKYGIYGREKSYKAGRIAAMSRNGNLRVGKFKSWFSAIFLPVERMKAQFPVVGKWPVLLPYYWIKRIVQLVRSNDLSKKINMLDYKEVNEEDYLEMKRFFKAGGV